jgi:hypothetical protein
MSDPNLLVIAVDGLRASALGAYGNTSYPTPALDQFAAESLVFDWCFADSLDPLSLCRTFWRNYQQDASTTLVTDEAATNSSAEAERFDEVVYLPQSEVLRAEDLAQTEFARLFAAAIDQVEQSDDRPRVVWIHSQGMYGSWDAPLELQEDLLAREEGDPPPADELEPPSLTLDESADPDTAFRWSCAYAAQVMALDECIAALVNAIDAAGRERWLVGLVGLRGFPLGEHGRIGGVDGRLYTEQLHVPALLRFPDGRYRLSRSAGLASPTDLCKLLSGAGRGDLAVGGREMLVADGPDGARSIRTAEWSLITGPVAGDTSERGDENDCQLFVRPDDRWEANDVASLCPDELESLLARLADSPAGER